MEDEKTSPIGFSEEGGNNNNLYSKKSTKTYYNAYDSKQNHFDDPNYYKQNLLRKKNFPLYTQ